MERHPQDMKRPPDSKVRLPERPQIAPCAIYCRVYGVNLLEYHVTSLSTDSHQVDPRTCKIILTLLRIRILFYSGTLPNTVLFSHIGVLKALTL